MMELESEESECSHFLLTLIITPVLMHDLVKTRLLELKAEAEG